jgi:predicted transcriptional regulator of viral defense system
MKKLNLHQVKSRLSSLGLKIFAARDVRSIFGASQRAAQAFLSYNVNKGAFIRLKAGLYALADNLPSEFAIANRLYTPSYISLALALSYYNLIPEVVYTITSVTPKPTREFKVNNLLYNYRRIKQPAYTGYIPKNIFGETVYIAEPEKAVADWLYYIYLGKNSYNDRLKLKDLDLVQLKKYLKLFSQPRLISLSQELLGRQL